MFRWRPWMGEFLSLTPTQMVAIVVASVSILASAAFIILRRWITIMIEKVDAIPSKDEFARWEAAINRIPTQSEMDDLKRAIGRIPSEDTKARVFEHFTRMEALDKKIEAHQILFGSVSSAIRRLENGASHHVRVMTDLGERVSVLETLVDRRRNKGTHDESC